MALAFLDLIPPERVTHSVVHRDCKKLVSVGVDEFRKVPSPIRLAITSAMNPYVDGKVFGPTRSIDIQKQTVLVFFCSEGWKCGNVASSCQCLKAGGPKGVRQHGPASMFRLSRGAETKVSNRRSSITNASSRLAACNICLNQRNPPFPYVQICAVIIYTCVFLVSEVNGEMSGVRVAKQGEPCYQKRFDMHIRILGAFFLVSLG